MIDHDHRQGLLPLPHVDLVMLSVLLCQYVLNLKFRVVGFEMGCC